MATSTSTLSALLTDLRRPFTVSAVRFKPQTVTKDLTKGLASFYIDARLAAERLNEVVGAENWSDEYRLLADGVAAPALYYPVECRLTVCGVTKADVGQGANTVLDDKAWKSAYSDALKRAAVKFGIGVYLYNLPNLWAPVFVGSNGKAQGFSKEGQEQLRGQYERWLSSPLNIYGEPFDHGDVTHDESSGRPEQPARTPSSPEPVRPTAAPTTTGFQAPTGEPTGPQRKLITDLCGKVAALPNATMDAAALEKSLGPVLTKQKASEVVAKLQRLLKNAEAQAA